MADNSILKIALIGGAGYLAYKMGWLSSFGIGTAPAPPSGQEQPPTVAPGTPAPPTTIPPPAPTANVYASLKLADLYTQFAAAAEAAQQAAGKYFGPDDYDAVLVQVFQKNGLPDPGLPDPNSVFGPSGWTRPYAMPLATYWAGISQWLAAHKGMSGLRGYAGLAGIAARQRGRRAA